MLYRPKFLLECGHAHKHRKSKNDHVLSFRGVPYRRHVWFFKGKSKISEFLNCMSIFVISVLSQSKWTQTSLCFDHYFFTKYFHMTRAEQPERQPSAKCMRGIFLRLNSIVITRGWPCTRAVESLHCVVDHGDLFWTFACMRDNTDGRSSWSICAAFWNDSILASQNLKPAR